jgi:hypothetical protein
MQRKNLSIYLKNGRKDALLKMHQGVDRSVLSWTVLALLSASTRTEWKFFAMGERR